MCIYSTNWPNRYHYCADTRLSSPDHISSAYLFAYVAYSIYPTSSGINTMGIGTFGHQSKQRQERTMIFILGALYVFYHIMKWTLIISILVIFGMFWLLYKVLGLVFNSSGGRPHHTYR